MVGKNILHLATKIFGKLKNDLKLAGTPLPINDVWIASHAMETGSVIVTYDRHFFRIPGVRVWQGLSIAGFG